MSCSDFSDKLRQMYTIDLRHFGIYDALKPAFVLDGSFGYRIGSYSAVGHSHCNKFSVFSKNAIYVFNLKGYCLVIPS